jgi:hypothetical protein
MKILYSISTEKLKPYPRKDDRAIDGLDSDWVVLEQINTPPPSYHPEAESIEGKWEVDLDNREYRLEWTILDVPEIVPEPEWDDFNDKVFQDLRFNQVYGTALQNAPLVASSLPTAMDQISSKESMVLFGKVYNAVCHFGGATSEDRVIWGDMARGCNLPSEFVSIVTG